MKKIKAILLLLALFPFSNLSAQLPEGADQIIRDEFGYPPKQSDFLSLEPGDEPNQYVLSVFEGAEQYLGIKEFLNLEKTFSKAKNIERVQQDDLEIFYVYSKEKDPDKILDSLWVEFLAASKISFGK